MLHVCRKNTILALFDHILSSLSHYIRALACMSMHPHSSRNLLKAATKWHRQGGRWLNPLKITQISNTFHAKD